MTPLPRPTLTALLLGTALAGPSLAQEAGVSSSHGYTNFGELAYGPDEVLDYVNPDAPQGGEFSTWSIGNFDSFNQYARVGVPAALNTIGTERLMTSVADDPYGSYCLICTEVEWDEDLTYATFTLREDVTFQNGTPVTAEDVKFTNDLFVEQGIPEYSRLAQQFYESVEVLGPYRIRFNFTDFLPPRDRVQQAGSTPVFSQAWFEESGARLDESTTEPFMSTGPYVLDSVDYNRRVVYAKDPDYWGADLPINQGRNNFDRIRVEYFSDSSAALEAFKAGEYLYREESDPADWNTGYENFRARDQGFVTLEAIPDGNVPQRLSWVFNLDREKWQDPEVREAVGMMFNFAWSNRALYYGEYEQPASFWSDTDLAAEGMPSEAEIALLQPLVDEGVLDEAVLSEPAATPVEHDASTNRPGRRIIREAANLLDEAGWETGEDGIRRRDGEVLSLTIIQFNPSYTKLVTPFLENLRLLGIRANLEQVDTAQYVERRRAGQFDLANQSFDMPFEPSSGLTQWFGSETADSSSRNLMRLRSEAVDALMEPVSQADTLDELTTSVHAFDRVLRHIGFDIPLYYNPDSWIAYYDVYDHPEDLPPLSVGAIDFWWYDDEAAQEMRQAGAL